MKNKTKTGFIDKFMAFNVNLADPKANTKWKSLTNFILDYENYALKRYNNNSTFIKITETCKNDDTPDKLMALGRYIEEFLNTADNNKLADDNRLLKIIEYYGETSIASNDPRAIDLATEIMKKIINIRKE